MSPFDDLTDIYEAMIDWDKRLAHESPFYRQCFERVGAQLVLDAACGTGRHAAMFHGWGLTVEGADISPAMIDRASHRYGTTDRLKWMVRAFDHSGEAGRRFDAVLCGGNSLALAGDLAAIERAVRAMLAAVRPGGVAIFHVLNLWRLDDGPCHWQKCQRAEMPEGDVVILKGVHRAGRRGFVDLAVASMSEGRLLRSESVPFTGIACGELDAMAREAGAAEVETFGGYKNQPYDRDTSTDLIVVALKGDDKQATSVAPHLNRD